MWSEGELLWQEGECIQGLDLGSAESVAIENADFPSDFLICDIAPWPPPAHHRAEFLRRIAKFVPDRTLTLCIRRWAESQCCAADEYGNACISQGNSVMKHIHATVTGKFLSSKESTAHQTLQAEALRQGGAVHPDSSVRMASAQTCPNKLNHSIQRSGVNHRGRCARPRRSTRARSAPAPAFVPSDILVTGKGARVMELRSRQFRNKAEAGRPPGIQVNP